MELKYCLICKEKLRRFSNTKISYCEKCKAVFEDGKFKGWGYLNERGDFLPEINQTKHNFPS